MVRPLVNGVAVKLSNTPGISIPSCKITSLNSSSEGIVYPNPTKGILHFNSEEDFTLFDLLGNILMKGNGTDVSLGHLNRGLYQLSIQGRTIMIIKE